MVQGGRSPDELSERSQTGDGHVYSRGHAPLTSRRGLGRGEGFQLEIPTKFEATLDDLIIHFSERTARRGEGVG